MTAPAVTATPSADLAHGERRRFAALAAVFLASGILLALAEWMAARGDGTGHFYVFWFGYFLVTAPVAWLLVTDRTSAAARGSLVVALGIWSLAPTLLRTGNHPLFFDEFSHFRMLQDLVRTGHPVGRVGLLQIGANFPGLELVTSGLYHLSGLTLWISALVIASVAHVALLAGVYVLVRDASRSSRAAAIAAVVYSLNPSWLIFDAQFSYETLALPMLVWSLVFALRGARRREPGTPTRARNVQIGLAAVLIAGLVVTHSVTSVVCAAALTGIALIATLQHRGVLRTEVTTSPLIAWCLAAWSVGLTWWRFTEVGHPLVVYLGPTFHFSQQLRQLLSLFGVGSSLPLHSAFANSSAPRFEIVCAYLMLPVLLVAFVWAVWGLLGARRGLTPLVYVAGALGVLFFASLPLASAVAYSEAVHRSWAFSFLGFAVVLGLAGGLALDGRLSLTVRSRRLWPPAERWRRSLRPGIAACAVVVAIGSVSLGSSTAYRFGGTVAPEVDPLYAGTQTTMVARWFAHHASAHDVVFANRFVIRPIAIASHVHVVQPGGTEVHLLLTLAISTDELFAYRTDRVTYVVYDRQTGKIGHVKAWYWYVPSDSLLPKDARGTPHIARLSCLNWLHAVFATSDYEVLRVDRPVLAADLRRGVTGLIAGCPERFGG
ncbi:MAG TPA: hypothetical protein VGZ03_00560 [Acidimicrobiales bacterium]|jgi:hypothetical protein|nr:hypothetical protein [Acidimicrobiales bacterium]